MSPFFLPLFLPRPLSWPTMAFSLLIDCSAIMTPRRRVPTRSRSEAIPVHVDRRRNTPVNAGARSTPMNRDDRNIHVRTAPGTHAQSARPAHQTSRKITLKMTLPGAPTARRNLKRTTGNMRIQMQAASILSVTPESLATCADHPVIVEHADSTGPELSSDDL